jgi:hypothetical protein
MTKAMAEMDQISSYTKEMAGNFNGGLAIVARPSAVKLKSQA